MSSELGSDNQVGLLCCPCTSQECFSGQPSLTCGHNHVCNKRCAFTMNLSTRRGPSQTESMVSQTQPNDTNSSTHSVVIGLSLRPLRCSRIWTSTRRVDSVQMEHICRTTPITTKLSSPAGKQGRTEGSRGALGAAGTCAGHELPAVADQKPRALRSLVGSAEPSGLAQHPTQA